MRHDDPRLGPYTPRGAVIRSAMELASDVDGLDYRSVPEEFVPYMRDAGVSEELIAKLMHGNPWNAFSR